MPAAPGQAQASLSPIPASGGRETATGEPGLLTGAFLRSEEGSGIAQIVLQVAEVCVAGFPYLDMSLSP